MSDIPTVKIKHPGGFAIINEADFDQTVHEIFDGSEPATDPDEITPAVVSKMTKSEVRDILDAHGVEYDGRTKVAGLRALAKRVMFVDL